MGIPLLPRGDIVEAWTELKNQTFPDTPVSLFKKFKRYIEKFCLFTGSLIARIIVWRAVTDIGILELVKNIPTFGCWLNTFGRPLRI